MSFHLFPFLPLDLRVQIWKVALQNTNLSVVSLNLSTMCPSKNGLSCASETILSAGSYLIALSCKEALSEWERTTSFLSDWASVRTCVSRTIFLLLDLAQLKTKAGRQTSIFTSMISHIQHISFFTETGITLVEVLTVLTNLNHLETISIILPSCNVEGTGPLDRDKIRLTAQFLASSADESSIGTHHRVVTEPVELYLEGSGPDRKFEVFYTRANAPSLRLVTPLCSVTCRHHLRLTNRSVGYSLF